MTTITVHCPGCGEALQVAVTVEQVVMQQQYGKADRAVVVSLVGKRVHHACPDPTEDVVKPARSAYGYLYPDKDVTVP